MPPFPALFVSHGSPMVALDDDEYNRSLARFAAGLPRPRVILVVSAHWEARVPIRVTAAVRPPTIHDFGGFPDELYHIQYPAPGAPEVAGLVVDALAAAGFDAASDPRRGLDHGAWVPLRFLYPAADVPVVGVSLPVPRAPKELLRLGEVLAPFRREGALVFGTGGVVHNLRLVRFENKHAPVEGWARQFDDWVAGRLQAMDTDGLAAYRDLAPYADRAVPTTEHFDPLFVVAGAGLPGEPATPVYEGFHHGNLSMRCFALS